jgi:hypothetical protein
MSARDDFPEDAAAGDEHAPGPDDSSSATAALSGSWPELAPGPSEPGEAPRTAGPRAAEDRDDGEPAPESSVAIARLPDPGLSVEVPIPDLPPPPDASSGSESHDLEAHVRATPAPLDGPPLEPPPEPPALGPTDADLAPEEGGAAAAPEGGAPAGAFPEPPPLAVVDEAEREAAPVAPGSEHDVMFGELARLQRFVSEEQLEEAIRISERLRAEGRPKKLGKIMVKLGFLSATQAKYLLRLQRTPDPIDGYKLLERRGQGGMGVVYRAVQKSLRREVAVKILAPKWAQHARFLQRFFREAKLAGELNHPNVVSAIDVGESNGLHYYAMEYVDGWSVAEILKEDGPFEEGEALDIVLQVAKALEHAAEHHIVHRDVKPENILVTPDGVAKLADLGLSKQLTSDCTITTEGKTLGTPFYVSPELARGARDVDVRSDIYSLGATLYHMLTGEPPFVGDNPAAIMARHIAEDPVPVKRRRRDVSTAMSKLVEKMMQKDAAKRYQSAEELLRDLIAIRKGKNPFAAAAREGADLQSTRAPAVRGRRVTTAPERPVYGGQYPRGAVIAAIAALVVAAVAVVLVIAAQRSGKTSGDAQQRAEAARGRPAPPPPAAADGRELAARARLAAARQEVEARLEQARYDEARAAVDALWGDAVGTSVEREARELRERVREETNRALEISLRKARHELESGRPDLALEQLREAPDTDAVDLAGEKARLKAEAERALAGRGR